MPGASPFGEFLYHAGGRVGAPSYGAERDVGRGRFGDIYLDWMDPFQGHRPAG